MDVTSAVLSGASLDSGALPALLAGITDNACQPCSQESVFPSGLSALESQGGATSSGSGGVASASALQPPVMALSGLSLGLETGPLPANPKVHCPVSCCPAHDPSGHPGFRNLETMGSHLDGHVLGIVSGLIPLDWLSQHRLNPCRYCGKLLIRGVGNGMHRKCWAAHASTRRSVSSHTASWVGLRLAQLGQPAPWLGQPGAAALSKPSWTIICPAPKRLPFFTYSQLGESSGSARRRLWGIICPARKLFFFFLSERVVEKKKRP